MSQVAKESLVVLVLTALLITLAATAGLPSRPTNVQADAASPNVAAKAPPLEASTGTARGMPVLACCRRQRWRAL